MNCTLYADGVKVKLTSHLFNTTWNPDMQGRILCFNKNLHYEFFTAEFGILSFVHSDVQRLRAQLTKKTSAIDFTLRAKPSHDDTIMFLNCCKQACARVDRYKDARMLLVAFDGLTQEMEMSVKLKMGSMFPHGPKIERLDGLASRLLTYDERDEALASGMSVVQHRRAKRQTKDQEKKQWVAAQKAIRETAETAALLARDQKEAAVRVAREQKASDASLAKAQKAAAAKIAKEKTAAAMQAAQEQKEADAKRALERADALEQLTQDTMDAKRLGLSVQELKMKQMRETEHARRQKAKQQAASGGSNPPARVATPVQQRKVVEPGMCVTGCGFHGNPQTGDMCSKCAREHGAEANKCAPPAHEHRDASNTHTKAKAKVDTTKTTYAHTHILAPGTTQATECFLCMEPFEGDDHKFFPCSCGYQVCRFCWHRIRNEENGLCPACRKPYNETPAAYSPIKPDAKAPRSTKHKQAANPTSGLLTYGCPNNMVGLIIGAKGATYAALQAQSGATIWIPQSSAPGSNVREIQIRGTPGALEKARMLIHGLVGSAGGGALNINKAFEQNIPSRTSGSGAATSASKPTAMKYNTLGASAPKLTKAQKKKLRAKEVQDAVMVQKGISNPNPGQQAKDQRAEQAKLQGSYVLRQLEAERLRVEQEQLLMSKADKEVLERAQKMEAFYNGDSNAAEVNQSDSDNTCSDTEGTPAGTTANVTKQVPKKNKRVQEPASSKTRSRPLGQHKPSSKGKTTKDSAPLKITCSVCKRLLMVSMFSKSQIKKAPKSRCLPCIEEASDVAWSTPELKRKTLLQNTKDQLFELPDGWTVECAACKLELSHTKYDDYTAQGMPINATVAHPPCLWWSRCHQTPHPLPLI